MEKDAEMLMRSTLHDLSNCLSGIRGILELQDPNRPLSPRERLRLEAVLSDGLQTLERSRHLAMGTLPDALAESASSWRHQLQAQLRPLATLFRCEFQVEPEGEDDPEPWPGELLRGYALAVTRQVLPFLKEGTPVSIHCQSTPRTWILSWSPGPTFPESLRPDTTRLRDISARWALEVGTALGVDLHQEGEVLRAFVPRT